MLERDEFAECCGDGRTGGEGGSVGAENAEQLMGRASVE